MLSLKNGSETLELSQRIKHARQQAGMNQAELGRKIGVTRATISAWEYGKIKNLRNDHLDALSRATGFDATFFISQDAQKHLYGDSQGEQRQGRARPYVTLNRIAERAREDWIEVFEDAEDTETFPRKWLGLSGKDEPALAWLTMPGEAMAPRIPHDSTLVIDKSDTLPREGCIYALDDGAALRVAYLRRLPENTLQLRFNHPEYPDEQRAGATTRILGRVIWYCVSLR